MFLRVCNVFVSFPFSLSHSLSLAISHTHTHAHTHSHRGFFGSPDSLLLEDNLQLCNRCFYDPVSTVIGCHWSCAGRKRLRDPFSWFPKRLFHCILWLKGSKSKIQCCHIFSLSLSFFFAVHVYLC